MKEVNTEALKMLTPALEKSENILIIGHIRPDGDAIGSTIGMGCFLGCVLGKAVRIVYPSGISEDLAFLTDTDFMNLKASNEGSGEEENAEKEEEYRRMAGITEKTIKGIRAYDNPSDKAEIDSLFQTSDLIICQDFNAPSRIGNLENNLRNSRAVKILIDHHEDPDTDFFDLSFSCPEASSTCELLYYILIGLLREKGIKNPHEALPPACAKALLTGMTTDTNNFANSTSASTLRMCADLVECGTDRNGIIDRLYHNYPGRRLSLLGDILFHCDSWAMTKDSGADMKADGERIMTITDRGVSIIVLSADTIRRHGIREGDTEGFVNIPLSIGAVKISFLLKEDEGRYRVSLRSKPGIDIHFLAREKFHGGGHAQASGGKLYFEPATDATGNIIGKDIADKSAAFDYVIGAVADFNF